MYSVFLSSQSFGRIRKSCGNLSLRILLKTPTKTATKVTRLSAYSYLNKKSPMTFTLVSLETGRDFRTPKYTHEHFGSLDFENYFRPVQQQSLSELYTPGQGHFIVLFHFHSDEESFLLKLSKSHLRTVEKRKQDEPVTLARNVSNECLYSGNVNKIPRFTLNFKFLPVDAGHIVHIVQYRRRIL